MNIEIPREYLGLCLENIVIDYKYQTIVYLYGDDLRIHRAYRGYKEVPREYLKKWYGDEIKMDNFIDKPVPDRYKILPTYYDAAFALYVSTVVRHLD